VERRSGEIPLDDGRLDGVSLLSGEQHVRPRTREANVGVPGQFLVRPVPVAPELLV